MAEMKALSAEIKKADEDLSALEAKQHELLLALPNLPDEDVCAGGKENNRVLRRLEEENRFLILNRKTMWIFARVWV